MQPSVFPRPLVVLFATLCLVPGTFAQDTAKKSTQVEQKNLNESLKEVINRGARIFNENGDYAGCYRMFEGALVAIRPVVGKEMQTEIDSGLTNAQRMSSFADKAFELRRVLDVIRLAEAGGSTGKTDPKTAGDKKLGTVTGKVTFAGKLASEATVVFKQAEGKAEFTSEVKGGSYKVSGLPAGKYQIGVSGGRVPMKLADPAKSGLIFRVSPGEQNFDLNLLESNGEEPKKEPVKEKLGEPKKTKFEEKQKSEPGKGAKGETSGRITVGGAPLTDGKITFDSSDGKFKITGKIQKDGTFKVEDLPAGNVRIRIDAGKKAEKTADIKGKVTVDGRPLTEGMITLATDDGKPKYTGKIEKDGTYKLGNVAAGKYKVVIEMEKEQKLVDVKYQKAETTPLRFEVMLGDAVFDIALTSSKK